MLTLQEVLLKDAPKNQEDIRRALKKRGVNIHQSSVSRLLRKLGAYKIQRANGETGYALPGETSSMDVDSHKIGNLVRSVEANGPMIVILTAPGSASYVASALDTSLKEMFMGTIAGDDTVFAIAKAPKASPELLQKIRSSFSS